MQLFWGSETTALVEGLRYSQTWQFPPQLMPSVPTLSLPGPPTAVWGNVLLLVWRTCIQVLCLSGGWNVQ
jgi:hypothetical protein